MARTVVFHHSGNFNRIDKFLKKMASGDIYRSLGSLAERGSRALASATPTDSGATAASWGWLVEYTRTGVQISWTNTNVHNGFVVAVGIQYGHGTGTGGYVQGIDYINPAIKPIFDDIANQVWEMVKSA